MVLETVWGKFNSNFCTWAVIVNKNSTWASVWGISVCKTDYTLVTVWGGRY